MALSPILFAIWMHNLLHLVIYRFHRANYLTYSVLGIPCLGVALQLALLSPHAIPSNPLD